MKKSKKAKLKNTDFLGNEWLLAPGGWEKMNQCQAKLTDCYFELKSLGALFCSLENSELSGEDLQGTGLTLQRLSRKIFKISNILSGTVQNGDADN